MESQNPCPLEHILTIALTKYLHCSSKNCLCIGSHWEKKKDLTLGSNMPYLGMNLHYMGNKYNFNINVHFINKECTFRNLCKMSASLSIEFYFTTQEDECKSPEIGCSPLSKKCVKLKFCKQASLGVIYKFSKGNN